MLLEGDPFTLIEGMVIAAWATMADEGYVYLRSEYPLAAALQAAIEAARGQGWLGRDILGSGLDFDLHLRVGGGAYICGEETSMLESLEGKRGIIRPRAVQVGSPLGSYVPVSQFDLPMDYEAFAAAGAMVGHGGIVVFDDTVDMARMARFAMEFCARESCGKCTPCRIGSGRYAAPRRSTRSSPTTTGRPTWSCLRTCARP
jgi:NADH:ubiquinone oxidoreductase subunit F (NADH-binding)